MSDLSETAGDLNAAFDEIRQLNGRVLDDTLRRRPPSKICGTCRRALNTYVDFDTNEVRYVHAAVSCGDHNPVDPDDEPVVHHCDFCLAEGPEWTFPCKPHADPNTIVAVDDEGHAEIRQDGRFYSHDDWACCSACLPLVEARDWRALWKRNAHIQQLMNERSAYHTARLAVLNIWIEFDRNRTGPPFLEPGMEVTS